jgi:signal transduction histidine kinase
VAVDELTGLALAHARAVAGMHGREVIHRDISPANVAVSADGAPCLVNFELASSLSELQSGLALQPGTVGIFAYMAPEQPGWTARPVDQRADLYALGATLYELATGQPPFGSGDPLALVHDHLARVPVPPAEVNPAVPGALSSIILHLLEKDPDDRYQSADGLVHDLERVRHTDAQGAEALRIGEHDLPPLLLPSSRLVGREAEVAALRAAFEDARDGRCRAVLVYYIVAEALTNAVKHAHASAVSVVVDVDSGARVLHLTVRDNGAGGASLTRGTGLIGLKDRAEALGGRLSLDSPPGTGTVLHAELPLAAGQSR